MRRRKSDERRERIVKIFMGVFVAFIMVFSVFQLMIGNDGSSYDAYSISYDQESGMYKLKTDQGMINFYTHPAQAEQVSMDPSVTNIIKDSQYLVLTLNPEKGSLDFIEQVRYELDKSIPKTGIYAVTANVSPYNSSPIIRCAQAQEYVPVFYFNTSSNLSIMLMDNCIVLNGNNSEFLMLRDRILYDYYGVIGNGQE